MNAIEALGELRRMGKVVFTTEEASIRLKQAIPATSMTLSRLAREGLCLRIARGIWTLDSEIDPLAIPESLTAPFPAYISFHSALYFHGMMSQIPQVIFVASLGPTRKVKTVLGTYSVHRLAPEFFGGYETKGKPPIRLASAEKALMDVLYLTSARSRLFARLPEIEIPRGFRIQECRRWIGRIQERSRKATVQARLKRILH